MSNEKSVGQGPSIPSGQLTPQTVVRSEKQNEGVVRERETPVEYTYAFGGNQQKLQAWGLDTDRYHYHWINDTPGRVAQALASGYTFVEKGEATLAPGVVSRDSGLGSNIACVVGKTEEGHGLQAYLMKIPSDLYERNQKSIQDKVDAVDRAISKGRLTGTSQDGFYVPKSGIKMSNKLGE